MARYSEVVYQKDFSGKNMKDAYMKACKWYANNILSNDELHDMTAEYIKDNENSIVTLRVSTSIEEKDVKAHHCAICKETHKAFFISENTNCAWCKVDAYHRRVEDSLNNRRAYYKGKIERKLYD